MQNPLSLLTSINGAAPLNNAKTAATQPPCTPFNQLLSREMASRPAAAPMPAQGNAKQPAAVKTVTPQPAQPAQATQKSAQVQAQQPGAKPAENQAKDHTAQPGGDDAAEPAVPIAKAGARTDAEAHDAASSADQAESDAEAAANVPVDLLALVASFNQPVAPTDKPQADAPAIAVDADAGAGRQAVAADAPLAAAHDTGAASGQTATSEAADAGAGQDFTAALASLTARSKDTTPAQTDAAPVDAKDVPVAAIATAAAQTEEKPAADAAPALSIAETPAGQPAPAEPKPAAAKTERPAARDAAGAQQVQQAAVRDAAPNPALMAAQAGAERQANAPVTPANTPQLSEIAAAAAGPAGAQAAPVQQAAFAMTQGAGDPAADKLSPPVGTPAWDQAVGQKVVWMVAGGQQSATLTLNPPDLGPLQVVVNVTNDQASADFSSNAPEVREALEAAMPKLRDMMSEAGIQLGSSTVGTGLPNQQMAQDQQNQPRAPRLAEPGGRAGTADADLAVRTNAPRPARAAVGLVDTFV